MSTAAMPAPTTVRDIMSRPVLTVEVGESLWDAWQLLFVSGLRHLVVLDADGRCLGVLSDRGILVEVPATAEHLSGLRVTEVIAKVSTPVVHPTDNPTHAAEVMSRGAIEALPVLDAGSRLVGIVTESDIVRWAGSGRI